MLENDTPSTRQDFYRCQPAVKAAVDKAREDWILRMLAQVESSMSKGGVQWECMKELQFIHRGHQPM